MKKFKILIVDDSVVYRSQVRAALQDIPWVEIVGAVSNGKIALERIIQTPPDILILDLEMPEMDGLETLKELRRRAIKCKVIVFSSASKRGAEITLESLRLGASDFVAKPGSSDIGDIFVHGNPAERIRELILPKLEALCPNQEKSSVDELNEKKYLNINWETFKPEIVVIGSSTGGPTVLEKIFSELKLAVKCPIVIVQHMPPVFTATFAERLGRVSGLPAAEAVDGMAINNGHIYVAPGGYHVRLKGTRDRVTMMLDQGPLIHSVRPAVDPLFETAASIYKDRCLGIVLTGMGADGRDGAIAVKQSGGAMVIQSEKSCTVFGMPGAVFSVGAYDKIAEPDEITKLIGEKVGF